MGCQAGSKMPWSDGPAYLDVLRAVGPDRDEARRVEAAAAKVMAGENEA
jgi:hypothetical protein